MDIPIKAKSYELEAVVKLNYNAPEIYKGKNPGFYWAAHQVSMQIDAIDWKKVAEYRLDKIFSGEGYESLSNNVNHLTLDDLDYEKASNSMTEQFGLKRPVQKAYCARNIIKWAIMQLEAKDVKKHIDNKLEDSLDDFEQMPIDDKLKSIYKKLIKIEEELKK